MNYSLTAVDRGYHLSFCDGFTSLITGLSSLPYSIRHWELSNKCEARYSFGHRAIAVLEAIPVLGGLAGLIERIVVFIYNKFSNSSSYPSENITEEISAGDPYEALKKAMGEKNSALYLKDETGIHRETMLGVLGKGGSKKAIQLSSGRALLLPNLSTDPVKVIAERWERTVLEEVKMSKILTRLGLLSPLSEQVTIAFDETTNDGIPAYVSETFENLGKTKGWFIIDTKDGKGCTWIQGENFLFKSDEERLNDDNWASVIDPLLTDIAKICLHNIRVVRDALNIAIVKRPSVNALCQYEVRYFGFDFSSKHTPLDFAEIQEKPLANPDQEYSRKLLDRILDQVLFYEFGKRYDSGDESDKLIDFKEQLVKKYSPEIVSRMKSYVSDLKPTIEDKN